MEQKKGQELKWVGMNEVEGNNRNCAIFTQQVEIPE